MKFKKQVQEQKTQEWRQGVREETNLIKTYQSVCVG